MKGSLLIALICLPWLLAWMPQVCAVTPVNCVWGPYGMWSSCDGCTKTQSRTRAITVYPQFHGAPCAGGWAETKSCETTQGCPLEEGCGKRFRCQSGACISASLVCNGDSDCEGDNLDEHQCNEKPICDTQKPPPNVEHIGKGYDAVRGQARGTVINTKSFGGQCRKVFSGDHLDFFRLPLGVQRYSFDVKAEGDFSDEYYSSSWSYVKDIKKREKTTGTTKGYHNYDFHDELKKQKENHLIIMKNDIEVAKFQNSPPEYLPLSEEFWKALSGLPVVFDYAAYRKVLERFGTHYISEGTLGGSFRGLIFLNKDFMEKLRTSREDFEKCVTTTHTVFFFFKFTSTHCNDFHQSFHSGSGYTQTDNAIKITVEGGYPSYIERLKAITSKDPMGNAKTFSSWAGSVKSMPVLTEMKLRSLHELVKEVPCASVKKLYLKQAIETYLVENHPCHCQPCENNGERVLRDNVCTCECRAGTEGVACEQGTLRDEQPGVVHGGWECWSAWSSCSGGTKTRRRNCNRPSPSGGGKHCIGESQESSKCDDEGHLDYLRQMEPHCFDTSLTPKETCGTPPSLINGYVQDPRDIYIVRNKIEYRCIDGFYLTGDAIAECGEDHKWIRHAIECKRTECDPPRVTKGVAATPMKTSYRIGEAVQLTCPEGHTRQGPSETRCDASLSWSPDSHDTKCQAPEVPDETNEEECPPWKRRTATKCVCRPPYSCKPSLSVCATGKEHNHTVVLSLCKVLALRCIGRQYSLAEDDSACHWPEPTEATCPTCPLWHTCNVSTNTCQCKTTEECSSMGPWISLCVRLAEGSSPVTMTECEAGVRMCQGETVKIVGLEPC